MKELIVSILNLVFLLLKAFFSAEEDRAKAQAHVEAARKQFEKVSEIIFSKFESELKDEASVESLDEAMEKERLKALEDSKKQP